MPCRTVVGTMVIGVTGINVTRMTGTVITIGVVMVIGEQCRA